MYTASKRRQRRNPHHRKMERATIRRVALYDRSDFIKHYHRKMERATIRRVALYDRSDFIKHFLNKIFLNFVSLSVYMVYILA